MVVCPYGFTGSKVLLVINKSEIGKKGTRYALNFGGALGNVLLPGARTLGVPRWVGPIKSKLSKSFYGRDVNSPRPLRGS